MVEGDREGLKGGRTAGASWQAQAKMSASKRESCLTVAGDVSGGGGLKAEAGEGVASAADMLPMQQALTVEGLLQSMDPSRLMMLMGASAVR